MYTRLIAPLFCVAAIVFACGPRPHSTADAHPPVPASKGHKSADAPPIASSMTVRVSDGVVLALHVTNNTDKQLEINFPSGQTHDFRVLDAAGREVWRWSAGRLFTQALQNKLLAAGETLTYEERWRSPAATGPLTAVATLNSTDHPVETRIEFSLP
jgi:hypothetical protein